MLIAVFAKQRPRLGKACLWLAMAVLLLGGNDWLIRWMGIPLEQRVQAPVPLPNADAIVVLGGALSPKERPRPTVEVNDAGDRVLYAFELFRQNKAPFILCAGGRAEPGVRETSEAEDMRTMLTSFGVPANAILVETNSLNTLGNAANCRPLIQAAGIQRILLVTSALHMPRALDTFKRQLPDIKVTPAPTDYEFTEVRKVTAKAVIEGLIPTGEHLSKMDRVLHEYVGMAYYWVSRQLQARMGRPETRGRKQ